MLYADDLTPDDMFDLGTWTPTAEEIMDFGRQWDPQPFHVDEAAAAETPIGGLFASGIHGLAILQRLKVLGFYGRTAVIAGKGMTDGRFLKPIRPGVPLRGRLEVLAVETRDDGRAVVTTRGSLHDPDDELVLQLTGRGLFAARPDVA